MMRQILSNSHQSDGNIEPLEGRRLLSVTITSDATNVYVTGTNDPESVAISFDSVNGLVVVTDGLGSVSGAASPAQKLVVDMAGGADSVVLSDTLGALAGRIVNGGAGDDTLYGSNYDDVLIGGSGNWDRLNGNGGNDKLVDGDGVFSAYGGEGNDILDLTFNGTWTKAPGSTIRRMDGRVQGGGGDDIIALIAQPNPVGTSTLFFSIKGDGVTKSLTDGNDTVMLFGAYTKGSVVNLDGGGTAPLGYVAPASDKLFAEKGGINLGGDPQVIYMTASEASDLLALIRS
jgi:hypothetical protein